MNERRVLLGVSTRGAMTVAILGLVCNPALLGQENSATKKVITLAGQVTDEQGGPVAEARLWLPIRYSFVRPEERLVAQTQTDEAGRFKLNLPTAWLKQTVRSPVSGQLWVHAPGHLLMLLSVQSVIRRGGADDLTLRLAPATATGFQIRDPDGKPLAGARVEPWRYKTENIYHIVPREVREYVGQVSNDVGLAMLPAMPVKGFNTARVVAEGFGPQLVPLDDTGVEPPQRTIRLCPAGRLEGRLVCDDPQYLRDADIFVSGNYTRKRDEFREYQGHAELVTDDEGRFQVEALAAGDYLVHVDLDPSLPVRPVLPDNVLILPGATRQVEIPLKKAVLVRGVIHVQGTKQPIANARISVRYGTRRQGDHVISDQNGRFETYVLPGRGYLQVIERLADYDVLADRLGRTNFFVPEDAETFELPPIEVRKNLNED